MNIPYISEKKQEKLINIKILAKIMSFELFSKVCGVLYGTDDSVFQSSTSFSHSLCHLFIFLQ